MARQARIKSNTGIYHVMIRGINKEKIFSNDFLKNKLLRIIKDIKEEIDFSIIAYCIMDNHLHLIIKDDDDNLAVIMKKICVKYAMFYNKIKERYGYVFQNRFRSEAIENEKYLYGALRYVHNNPVNAYITNDFLAYTWSSINEYMNEKPEIICCKYKKDILNSFGNIDEFVKFHSLYDNNIYIDTIEEESVNIEKVIQNTIEQYAVKNNLVDAKDFTHAHKERLARILINLNLITKNRIAELCNLSFYNVKMLSKEGAKASEL